MIAAAFPTVAADVLDVLLEMWLHRRWICRVGDRYISVLPRKGPGAPATTEPPVRERVREPVSLRLIG